MSHLSEQKECQESRGFAALSAVIVISSSVLLMSATVLSSVVNFADMVWRKEMRMQARLNLEACLNTAEIMFEKDVFMQGHVTVEEFGCELKVQNSMDGLIEVDGRASFKSRPGGENVSAYGHRSYGLSEQKKKLLF